MIRERRPIGPPLDSTSQMSRSREQIVCPFCNQPVWTYIWSRHGSGKRCACGALLCGYVALAPEPKKRRATSEPEKTR